LRGYGAYKGRSGVTAAHAGALIVFLIIVSIPIILFTNIPVTPTVEPPDEVVILSVSYNINASFDDMRGVIRVYNSTGLFQILGVSQTGIVEKPHNHFNGNYSLSYESINGYVFISRIYYQIKNVGPVLDIVQGDVRFIIVCDGVITA
jgi:hypothetical protein